MFSIAVSGVAPMIVETRLQNPVAATTNASSAVCCAVKPTLAIVSRAFFDGPRLRPREVATEADELALSVVGVRELRAALDAVEHVLREAEHPHPRPGDSVAVAARVLLRGHERRELDLGLGEAARRRARHVEVRAADPCARGQALQGVRQHPHDGGDLRSHAGFGTRGRGAPRSTGAR
jgi:hypothetical protein